MQLSGSAHPSPVISKTVGLTVDNRPEFKTTYQDESGVIKFATEQVNALIDPLSRSAPQVKIDFEPGFWLESFPIQKEFDVTFTGLDSASIDAAVKAVQLLDQQI